jgi:pimeloyl-ACP methyl ester carboxylesterase
LFAAAAVSIAYLAFGGYFYFSDQSRWIAKPHEKPSGYHGQKTNFVVERFSFDVADEMATYVVHYRRYRTLEPTILGTIFYLHGQKGNMDQCEWEIDDFLRWGFDVWTMDYRGFGESTGKISEKSLRDDAGIVYNRMKDSGLDESEIIIWGRSFGSGVAASIVAEGANPRQLVLETPYWSLPDAARFNYVLLPDFLFHFQLPVHDFLLKSKCPVHLIHGTWDEKIPFSSTERLCMLAKKNGDLRVRSHPIACGLHNLRPEPEFQKISKWILCVP